VVGVVVAVQGQANLLKVVLAFQRVGRLPNLLHGGEKQADQNGDDSDNDQEFDERESYPVRRCAHGNTLL
jgi:hypothetical protein